MSITNVQAWEALDSRGNPTVACRVSLDSGASGYALVPSGASTGAHEAHELRDGDPERYGGKGVRTAVTNVVGPLRESVLGADAHDQIRIDRALCETDGTANLGRLGANAVLAVSLGTALAAAADRQEPLYRCVGSEPLLPMPMVNILSGGAHAGWSIDVQDFLAVPVGAESFAQAIEWVWRIRRSAVELAKEKDLEVHLIADEGGLGARLPSNRAACELLTRAIEHSGLRLHDDAAIAIDVASSQLVEAEGYRLASEGRTLQGTELVEELATWVDAFPIVSLEDPLAEDDWSTWRTASDRLSGCQLLGDDLLVTDAARLLRAIDSGVANAVLVKPNQAGTLSRALDVVRQAQAAGYANVLSARSGETEQTWLADLAVGWQTGQIKVGSTMRSERTAKWNRLLEIEAELGSDSRFAGRSSLAPLTSTGQLSRTPDGAR